MSFSRSLIECQVTLSSPIPSRNVKPRVVALHALGSLPTETS
jgi:hypothetical protein